MLGARNTPPNNQWPRAPQTPGRDTQTLYIVRALLLVPGVQTRRRPKVSNHHAHAASFQTMDDLLAAHRHTSNNQAEIEASRLCGCCCCMQIFPPSEIVAWGGLDVSNFDNPDSFSAGTALCPRCGSEAVIGDRSGYRIQPDFLGRMNEAWFQRTIIRKPRPKA